MVYDLLVELVFMRADFANATQHKVLRMISLKTLDQLTRDMI